MATIDPASRLAPCPRTPNCVSTEAPPGSSKRMDPIPYTGSLDENHLLPTAIGVPKPSALVPITMAAGDLRAVTEVLAVGFRGLKDYHPALLADGLRRTMPSVTTRAIELQLPGGSP